MSSEIKIYGNPPASLVSACQRHADKIAEVGSEGDDGYWIYLRPGWWDRESGCGTIHEYTVRDCLDRFCFITPDPRSENER